MKKALVAFLAMVGMAFAIRGRFYIEPASVLPRVPYIEIALGAGLLALGFAGGFYCGRKGKKSA